MQATYRQEQEGLVEDDDILDYDIPVLNEKFSIASEDAELIGGSVSLPVSQALNQMITISHNYSALMLADKVTLASVSAVMLEDGLTHSSITPPPTTSSRDTEIFFKKLYNHALVDTAYSDKMLDLLKDQQINDRIPAELPQDVVVAHKTGELEGYRHGAGIVYAKNGPYLLIMISNTPDPSVAVSKMADLSKKIYDYFENK